MSDIQIQIDDKKLQKYFDRIISKIKRPRPLLLQLGQIMHEAVNDNFEANGRPKWAPLSASTKKQKAKKGYTGPQILRQTGKLARSITRPKTKGRSVSIGTNLEYAALHHFGFKGNMRVKAHTKKVGRSIYSIKTRKKLKKKRKSAAYVRSHTRNTNVPARPFMKLTAIDIKDMIKTLKEYVDDPRFPD